MDRKKSSAEKAADLDARMRDLATKSSLESVTSFVRDAKIPSDLLPAFLSNRPELIGLAPARDMTAEEGKYLYDLIRVLMETNQALREHSLEVSKLVEQWGAQFKGMARSAMNIEKYAAFDHDQIGADEELENA